MNLSSVLLDLSFDYDVTRMTLDIKDVTLHKIAFIYFFMRL